MMSSHSFSRRTLLKGTLVVAFNPLSRSWAVCPEPGTIKTPELKGRLLYDDDARERAGEDFGYTVHCRPCAVLVPGAVDDIVQMVRFAKSTGLKVAASRGLGESHSYYGQAQVDGGLVIDMSALSKIHEITSESAWVDAGVRWNQLLEATILLGKSPKVLTDYLGLSIGGTLSVGGIGGHTFRHGLQVDNVLELDVVTGTGELVRCSRQTQPLLFNAALGGLGQCGIIVRARIQVENVLPRARIYSAEYTNLSLFMKDQIALIRDRRFDYVEGDVQPGKTGWVFVLQMVKYFAPEAEPDDQKLLKGLPASAKRVGEKSYFEYSTRLDKAFADQWRRPHPWLDMFVPSDRAESFVNEVLSLTPKEDVGMGVLGRGVVLLSAFPASVVRAPLARMPNSKDNIVFLFSLLRTAVPAERAGELITKNREIFDKLTAAGGKRYGAGAIKMDSSDWQRHFGDAWEGFRSAKLAFDPGNILTPGQKIFVY